MCRYHLVLADFTADVAAIMAAGMVVMAVAGTAGIAKFI
jgi:hypothetical protein